MTFWTLEHDSTEKAFPSTPDAKLPLVTGWGLTSPTLRFQNQGISTCEFEHPTDFDGDPIFDFGDKVIVRVDRTMNANGSFSGGRTFFTGWVTQTPRTGEPNRERIGYLVSDAWYWLTQKVYRQRCKIFDHLNAEHEPVYREGFKSRVYMNSKLDGDLETGQLIRINSAEQIALALQLVLDQGQTEFGEQLFQFDSSEFPSINYPWDEVAGVTCEEVILRQLRLATAMTWFDHSTSPATFHCVPYADLDSFTLKLPPVATDDETTVESCSLAARYDLKRPSVLITYERTDTQEGRTYTIITDPAVSATYSPLPRDSIIAPDTATGEEFGALQQTIQLEGFLSVRAYAPITTVPIYPDYNSLTFSIKKDWWNRHVEWLSRGDIIADSLKITVLGSFDDDGNAVNLATLPNELIDGQIPDWLSGVAVPVTIKALFAFQKMHGLLDGEPILGPDQLPLLETESKPVSVRVMATNLETGIYSIQESFIEGEVPPEHFAQQIYNSLSILYREGTVVTHEQEAWTVVLGKTLNLDAGSDTTEQTAWKTMNALVQSVSIDSASGRTEISVGPPKVLNAQDLMELLRFNRSRRIYTAPQSVANSISTQSNQIGLGRETALRDSGFGDLMPFRLPILQLLEDGTYRGFSVDGSTTPRDPHDTNHPVVVVNPYSPSGTPGGCRGSDDQYHKVTLREISVCEDGVERKVIALVSEAYDVP